MSNRKFANFVDAYLEYAADGFSPHQFSLWSCLSVIAGALERKVWLPWNDTFSYYPNIYVMLVSMPGDGKSVSLNKAVRLLYEVNGKSGSLNIMPNQVTEAKFIELMGNGRSFLDKSSGREIQVFQNAGYYWASEASNSLRNVFGDFIACLTDFYDCPTTWERATKKDGKKICLKNVCMNMIAGSTFDYLGKLVNDENIMGGFASRIIYVVSKNKEVVDQPFQQGSSDEEEKALRLKYRNALVEDLSAINQMTGPMRADKDFGQAWEAWYPTFERERRQISSEKVQSILARTNTNILKVSMLLSAAESDDRRLKLHHWERAHEMVTTIQGETPGVFREARANGSDRSNGNIANAIIHAIGQRPGVTFTQVKAKLVMQGFHAHVVEQSMQALITSGMVGSGAGGADTAVILGDTKNYL